MKRTITILSLLTVFGLTTFLSSHISGQEFKVNTQRLDPYKQYKFRVKWDGKYIPGIHRVSGLVRKTEVVMHRVGGDPNIFRRSPGLTTYEPLVMERRRTHDTSFEEWANKVYNYGAGLGSEVSLKDFRKDIIIELYNEAGQTVMAFKVYRCWPSDYSALGELDSNGNAIAIESLVLQYEGFERDLEVPEPTEH